MPPLTSTFFWATKIHRAALLNQTGSAQGKGWIQFLSAYFPAGRNGEGDAQLLWDDWRTGLVKDRAPEGGVSITHGHPEQHWKLDGYGALCIDLESMWVDFEYSVNRFVEALEGSKRHAEIVVARYRKDVDGTSVHVASTDPWRPRPVEGCDAPARGRRHSVEPTAEDLVAGRSRSRSRSAASG